MRQQRYYSLFERQGRRWVRLTEMAFLKPAAVRVFRDALLSQSWWSEESRSIRPCNELSLRPVEGRP